MFLGNRKFGKRQKPIRHQHFLAPKNTDLGSEIPKLGMFLGKRSLFGKTRKMGEAMRKKGFKGRCEKRMLGKSEAVCRLYDPIQSAYADRLQADTAIREFQCNVPLDDGEHMTDFLCVRTDGENS